MALRPKAVEVSSTVERYLVLPRYLQTYTKKSLFMLARVGDPEFNLIGSHGYLFLTVHHYGKTDSSAQRIFCKKGNILYPSIGIELGNFIYLLSISIIRY